MTKTYQSTGIILKGMPFGEADRLVTILTAEHGLVRAIVPGARKHKSRLRGRSELFVVNQLVLVKGRSLDKVTQAETLESYPGLSRDLGKLVASQYLAELVMSLALSEQPQIELYELLNEHLRRLEKLADMEDLVAYLAHAVFHVLAIAGIAPQIHRCCFTQSAIEVDFSDRRWRVGFSFEGGGLVALSPVPTVSSTANSIKIAPLPAPQVPVNIKLGAVELTLLQNLGAKTLPPYSQILPEDSCDFSLEIAWIGVERLLRDYAQYHCGRTFRSAALLDNLCPLDF